MIPSIVPQPQKVNRCALCRTAGQPLTVDAVDRLPFAPFVRCEDELACARRSRSQHGPTSPGGSSAVAA